MPMFDPELLLAQLAELGRQLDDEVTKLTGLDVLATAAAVNYTRLREEYDDSLARAFLDSDGSVEARKMQARLSAYAKRIEMGDAYVVSEEAKSAVRNQQALIRAIHARIDVGRSLLSTEKARMDLDRLPDVKYG